MGRLALRARALLRQWLSTDALISAAEQQRDQLTRVLTECQRLNDRLTRLENNRSAADQTSKGQLKEMRVHLAGIDRTLHDIRHQLGSRGLQRSVRALRLDTRALLRRDLIDPASVPYPHRLTLQRASITSQWEDDGILLAVLKAAGPPLGLFVDIGSGGEGGVSGFLARECGWRGLMIDGNAAHVAQLRHRFSPRQITAVSTMVTRENANDVLRSSGFEGEIDLLSIDIDGMDYWVWETLDVVRPRIVVVEYNPSFGLERAVAVPYAADFSRTHLAGDVRKTYFGASLPALVALGRRKGYRLVTIEPNGLNAFFLRTDLAPEIPACAPAELPYAEVKTSREEDAFALLERERLPLVEVRA